MEKWMVFLPMILVLFMSDSLLAYSGEYYYDLRIDCGASKPTPVTDDGLISWFIDDDFIKTGENHILTFSQNFSTMNSLRSFPDGQKNCYFLPLFDSNSKFLFRAGFYYGNYDGLSKPPTFNLEIDGNLWANVTTTIGDDDEPIYHEIIYITNGDGAQVCLVGTNNGVPFISSLEATVIFAIGFDMYRLMENKTALLLESRIHYGANKSIEERSHKDDWFNRIWKSKKMSEYLNIDDGVLGHGTMFGENNPPWPVMDTAIQAKNLSESIYLTVNFSSETAVAYLVLYFRDPISRYPNDSKAQVEISVDGQKLGSTYVPPSYYRPNVQPFSVVTLYPVEVHSSATVTISPASNSTLPPLLNAIEVFSVVNVSTAGYLPSFSVAKSFVLFSFVTHFFFFFS